MSKANPHDSGVKAVFSQTAHAAAWSRSVLPSAVCELIDWPTRKMEPDTHVRVLARASGGVEALAIIFRYIILACEMEPEELSSFAWNEVNPKASEAFMTTAEIIEQRAREKEHGRTLREILLRQLQKRFGELPQAITERIRDAEPEKLNLWLDNVVFAQSLSDVFA